MLVKVHVLEKTTEKMFSVLNKYRVGRALPINQAEVYIPT